MKLPALLAVPFGLAIFGSAVAHAQSLEPKFEVASVRPHAASAGFIPQTCSGDRFRVAGLMLIDVIVWAYDLGSVASSTFRQQSGPRIRRDAYDMEGKASAPFASDAQCRTMVQSMLVERFKMTVHWDAREGEIGEMVVANGGPKMQKLPADQSSPATIFINGRRVMGPPDGKGISMEQLAQRLSGLDAGVFGEIVDKTGLEGRFEVDLRASTSNVFAQDPKADPPLETALQQQLGLRLEKHKGSIKLLVLDRLELPDAN